MRDHVSDHYVTRDEILGGIPESVRGVPYLPAPQLMAFQRSMAKGSTPTVPRI